MKDNDKYFERLEQLDWTEAQTKRLSSFAFPGRDFALIGSTEQEVPTQGLTKREYFAGKILQAMLSNPAIVQHNKEKDSYLTDDVIMSGLVVHAINYTDELLKALEQ